MSKASVSTSAKKLLLEMGTNWRTINSWFPVDKYDCECQPELIKIKKNPDLIRYIECPKDKTGMKHYEVSCKNCNQLVAVLWAYNKKLEDWCDLHYISKHDLEKWYGCLAVNVSPIDGTLGFECACGQDTRDFRANTNLPAKALQQKLKETEKGREFGKASSKFKVKEI